MSGELCPIAHLRLAVSTSHGVSHSIKRHGPSADFNRHARLLHGIWRFLNPSFAKPFSKRAVKAKRNTKVPLELEGTSGSTLHNSPSVFSYHIGRTSSGKRMIVVTERCIFLGSDKEFTTAVFWSFDSLGFARRQVTMAPAGTRPTGLPRCQHWNVFRLVKKISRPFSTKGGTP